MDYSFGARDRPRLMGFVANDRGGARRELVGNDGFISAIFSYEVVAILVLAFQSNPMGLSDGRIPATADLARYDVERIPPLKAVLELFNRTFIPCKIGHYFSCLISAAFDLIRHHKGVAVDCTGFL